MLESKLQPSKVLLKRRSQALKRFTNDSEYAKEATSTDLNAVADPRASFQHYGGVLMLGLKHLTTQSYHLAEEIKGRDSKASSKLASIAVKAD